MAKINNPANQALATFSAILPSTGATFVTGDGTVYKIIGTSTTINDGGYYSTTTGAYTVPTTAVYLFVLYYASSVTMSVTSVKCDIYVGGVSTYTPLLFNPNYLSGSSASYSAMSISAMVPLSLTAGQVLTFYITGSGGSKEMNMAATISGFLLT